MYLQVTELLFIFQEGLKLDHLRAERRRVVIKGLVEFRASLSKNSHLETVNTLKTPHRFREGLDELAFAEAERFVGIDVRGGIPLIFGSFFRRQQHGASSDARVYGCEAIGGEMALGIRPKVEVIRQ